MKDPETARLMARYNAWQNASMLDWAETLTDAARREDRGAFFGSIHRTISHLLWADRTWLSRFGDYPKPEVGMSESPDMVESWPELVAARRVTDKTILAWAEGLTEAWLAGELTWFSGAAGRELTAPRWALAQHFFNHQTHHRGQIHAMGTAAGARPGPTDLMVMPDAF